MFFFNRVAKQKLVEKTTKKVQDEDSKIYEVQLNLMKSWAFHRKKAEISLLKKIINEQEKEISGLREELFRKDKTRAKLIAQLKLLVYKNRQFEKIGEQMFSMIGQNDSIMNKTEKLLKEDKNDG